MFEIAWQLDGIFSKLCVFYIFYSKYNNFVIFTQNQRRTSLGSSVYRQESIKKSIFGWLFEYGTFSITVLMALLTKKTFTRTWLSCESGSKMFHIQIISGIWNIVQGFHIQEIVWIWNLPNHYTNGIADKKGIHQNSTILMSGERVQRFSQNLNNVE